MAICIKISIAIDDLRKIMDQERRENSSQHTMHTCLSSRFKATNIWDHQKMLPHGIKKQVEETGYKIHLYCCKFIILI